jgi:hypothetical protein
MEVPALAVVCHEGCLAADDIFRPFRRPAASTFSISLPRSRTRGRDAGGAAAACSCTMHTVPREQRLAQIRWLIPCQVGALKFQALSEA